jgi:phage-related tail fiber protein
LAVADVTGAAADASVLHIAGTETITGAKTFSSLITGSISGNAGTVTTNANLTGDVTSTGNTTTLSSAGTAGTYRSVTTDAKGRVTAGTNPTTLAGYGITDANPAFTGDVTKTTNGTVLTLSSTGVGAGTYRSVTVDVKGRVTAGTSPTTLSGYGITDAVNSSLLGTAAGVATLDGAGTLPAAQVPAALVGASVYKGAWNATTNTPLITDGVGVKGNYYNIASAGSTNIDGNATWLVGDRIIYTGTAWERMEGTPPVITSVAGRTGAITLTKADVTDLVSRTITGTSNQITVTNGDGVAGNPVLSITPNPVLPGTAALTIPVGSTAQRPGTPVAGALRFNSSLVKYENYDGTTWKNVATENFVSAGYQPLDADLTSISAMVSTGLAVNAGAGTWAARTLIPPASGFTITNPDGVSGNPTFALSGDLAAIEALSTTGLLARTGTNTWIPRVLTGSTNQIAITNADGVVGDPTISLAANVIFPGTGSITVPVGTTAQRTVGPVSGAVRYNSTLDKYEFYQSGQWTTAINGVAPGVVPSQMTQLLTGQVPAIAGTNSMPFDNNVPVSTNGMFLFSRSITTSAAGTRILFAFPFWLDTSTNATIIMQVFRNPFTGYQIINIGANKTVASATNYVSGTTYNATITLDGVAKPISLLGSNASTYATLINGINNALGTAGTAMFAGGNLRIVSATSSTTSTVSIVNGSPAMFASPLNGFVSILTAVPGSTPGCLISIPNTITAKGNSSSITIVDTPGTGTFTYTVRVGTNTGTFYINQNAAGNNFGGFNTTSYSLMEVV